MKDRDGGREARRIGRVGRDREEWKEGGNEGQGWR